MRLAIDRPRPKPSCSRAPGAAVEALEHPTDLVGCDPVPGVLDLDQNLAVRPPARAKRNGAGRRRVLERVRQQADQHLPQEDGVALGGELVPDVDAGPRARPGGATACAASSITNPTSIASVVSSPTASMRARVSSESVRRLTRSASSDSLREEVVARLGVVLGTGAQDLDRARDAGDRVPQLVRRVGDELPLGDLAAKLLGAIADHREHGVLGRQLPDPDRVDADRRPEGRRARRRRARQRAAARGRARRWPCRPGRSAARRRGSRTAPRLSGRRP